MPEIGRQVLAWVDDKPYLTRLIHKNNGIEWETYEDFHPYIYPTHWMPLPEGPKDEEENDRSRRGVELCKSGKIDHKNKFN